MFSKTLLSPNALRTSLPLSHEQQNFIIEARTVIQNILTEKDSRMLLCIGPCSVHNINAFLEFARLFKDMIREFSSKFYFVLRAYFEKPRTNGGWPGFLYDPFLDNSSDISTGIYTTRSTLLELCKLRIPIVTEFVDPLASYYLEDLVSFVCIGARTVTSPIHRRLASNLSCPIGFKNCLSGSIEDAVYGMNQASISHAFIGINSDGKICRILSKGNPYNSVILRGGINGPNYTDAYVEETVDLLRKHRLPTNIIIDCAHGNSKKDFYKQIDIFESMVYRKVLSPASPIKGMFLESYLKSHNQILSSSTPKSDISITDPCLDWNSTYNLVKKCYLQLTNVTTVTT